MIGPTLANSIPETGNSFEDFINPSISSFSLTETNVGVRATSLLAVLFSVTLIK